MRPEEFHRGFVEAFNSGDVESLVSLYERDGVLVPAPDHMACGYAAIREALR